MKIAIIGSHQYLDKFTQHQMKLMAKGHEVRIPAMDSHPDWSVLQIWTYNRELIQWADRVDVIWDQRSTGTIFDFGMCFMAGKPVKTIYLEPKTITGGLKEYEESQKTDE